jgi:two-component system, chemotaxis family, protein-glutamate methylesterase/glutaminase
MPSRDIIVIGGSAGAVTALRRLCADLPSDLPAAVFAVVHIASRTGISPTRWIAAVLSG